MNNFAVLTIAYSHTATSIITTITTNTPCHLTCYYTDKAPVRHRTSRTDRGLTLPWGAYFCFVAWKSVEQQEPGDTLTHTFEIPDWAFCHTKYFAFRGTVAGVLSPSVSPIFRHHHPGAYPLIEEQTIATATISMDQFRSLRLGQRLIISKRRVIHLGFWLCRISTPTGDVTFTIRRVSDDSLITAKTWGDAIDLPEGPPTVYKEVELDTPVTIDEEVKILAEFSGGDYVKRVGFGLSTTDVKPDEYFVIYRATGWTDYETFDAAYRYTYYQQ